MNAKRDAWLVLTVISCLVALLSLTACFLSFLAEAKWERESAEAARPRRIRIDLRVPAVMVSLGSTTLAVCSYRFYTRHLRKPE